MSDKDLVLPKPNKVRGVYEWHPVVRVGRTIPFGYRQDPDDPNVLLPIPEQLEKLELAKEHLKKYSYREVATWLTNNTGRYISHVGLMKRVKLEKRRKTQATIQANLVKRYEAAIRKAQELETTLGGSATKTEISCGTETSSD